MYKIINKTSTEVYGILIPHYDIIAVTHTKEEAEKRLKELFIEGPYHNLMLWSEYNGTY